MIQSSIYYKMDISFVLKQIDDLEHRLKLLKEYISHNAPSDSKEDTVLYEKLRILRNTIANEENVSPFLVFHNNTLHEIAERCPVTLEDFRKIKGIGNEKCIKYYSRFNRCILEHINN